MTTSLIRVMQPLLNEHGYKITPIMFKGKLIILPKEIEEQFGFKDLSHSIANTFGLIKDSDYFTLDGTELKQLKELLNVSSNSDPVGKNANSLMVLTESGLYALAFRSNKEPLVEFRLWVTEQVLPTIARTGGYALSDTIKNITKELNALYQSSKDSFAIIKDTVEFFIIDKAEILS